MESIIPSYVYPTPLIPTPATSRLPDSLSSNQSGAPSALPFAWASTASPAQTAVTSFSSSLYLHLNHLSLSLSLSLSENIPPLLISLPLPLSTLLSPLPLGSLPSYCSPCSFSSFSHSVFLSWILPSLPVSSLKLSLSRVWKHVNRSGCGAECMHWRCSGECVCVCVCVCKRDSFNWKPRLIPDSWFFWRWCSCMCIHVMVDVWASVHVIILNEGCVFVH